MIRISDYRCHLVIFLWEKFNWWKPADRKKSIFVGNFRRFSFLKFVQLLRLFSKRFSNCTTYDRTEYTRPIIIPTSTINFKHNSIINCMKPFRLNIRAIALTLSTLYKQLFNRKPYIQMSSIFTRKQRLNKKPNIYNNFTQQIREIRL